MNCWICEIKPAESGEHALLKAAYERIFGTLVNGKKAFFSYVGGPKNIPIGSFKHRRLKFPKSLCKDCNNSLTQSYDTEFLAFIERLIKSKSLIVSRNKIALPGINANKLGLYFLKIFGCLIVEQGARIKAVDFKDFRHSLLCGKISTSRVFISAHRDISKLRAKKFTTVSMLPVIQSDYCAWLIDLDWISFVISYPFAPQQEKYGKAWRLGSPITYLPLGRLH